jgi:two-component system, chemotaxis family, response regulator WspF
MRIAIVNDQRLAVEALKRSVIEGTRTLAWVARDGEEAVRMAAQDRPDLILMDLIMPIMDGAVATKKIMAATPCPILVVTATVSGNFTLVYEALSAGAVDAVNTPTLGLSGETAGAEPLISKIQQIARKMAIAAKGTTDELPALRVDPAAVVIGSSTGGPQALAEMLAQLPPHFPACVVIAQHIDAEFSLGLVDWLRPKIGLPIRIARSGDTLASGLVLVAGQNDHLALQADGKLQYIREPVETPFRPNIDVLFESFANHHRSVGHAVLLTGMGRDGAAGLLELRRTRWITFAQSQASSAVFGMPDAAIKLGAAMHVLSPTEIGRHLATYSAA